MSKISSKFLSLLAISDYLNAVKTNADSTTDGIILLTAFGIVYGKVHTPSDKDSIKTDSDWLLNRKEFLINDYTESDYSVINDGSTIIIKDAIVKYANNMTLSMNEIIIFADQVIGFYPVDLASISSQIP